MSAPKPSLSELAKALEAAGGPRLYPWQLELLERLERGETPRPVWMRDPGKSRRRWPSQSELEAFRLKCVKAGELECKFDGGEPGTSQERPAGAATRSATSGLR